MNDTMKMLLVLSSVTSLCGGLLGGVRQMTQNTIERKRLHYETGPAVYKVLTDTSNDPLNDRRVVTVRNKPITLFEQKNHDTLVAVAFETSGMGYGGPLSVVTGYDVSTGTCKGIAISQSKETPGIGSRVNSTAFSKKFVGLSMNETIELKKDGGTIDGVSGATISSRAVCSAVEEAQRIISVIQRKQLLE